MSNLVKILSILVGMKRILLPYHIKNRHSSCSRSVPLQTVTKCGLLTSGLSTETHNSKYDLFNQIWSCQKFLTSVPRTDVYLNVISSTKYSFVRSYRLPWPRSGLYPNVISSTKYSLLRGSLLPHKGLVCT